MHFKPIIIEIVEILKWSIFCREYFVLVRIAVCYTKTTPLQCNFITTLTLVGLSTC